MTGRHYTANLQKGGAMLAETIALLREWRPGMSPEEFVNKVVARNPLGKATRARARDILGRVFFRRFDNQTLPATHIQRLLTAELSPVVVNRILYLYAALADDLLYDFATDYLYRLYHDGRWRLGTDDAVAFIESLIAKGDITPPWSENIKLKTGRGLLATLRDFGLLEGQAMKHFTPAFLPIPAFLFMAYHLGDIGIAGARLITHPHWRLYFLTPDQVERLYGEAHQMGHLGYYAAGGTVRVEWRYDGLGGVVEALAETAHRAT